jgi:hypothetical protein
MNMTSGRAGAGAATTETSGGGGSCLAYGDGCLQKVVFLQLCN